MSGKNLKGGLTKHFLGINPIISGANTPLRKFVGDIGYHFSLSSIVLQCVGLLLTVLCIHSHIIFIVSFISSRFHSHYFVLVSERISVKEYGNLSFPFTHAFLLLYLMCKEHLFVTFLCLFCSFLYFLFSFISFMPTS